MFFLNDNPTKKQVRQTQQKALKKALKNVDSIVYKELWGKLYDKKDPKDFEKLPYIESKHYQRAVWELPTKKVYKDPIRFWYCTSGTTTGPRWVPKSAQDWKHYLKVLLTCYKYSLKKGDVVLNMYKPMPIGSGTTTLALPDWVEEIPAYPHVRENALRLAIMRQPTTLTSMPSAALFFAKQKFRGKKMLQWFPKLKKLILAAEPLEPYRQALEQIYGTKEIYNRYGSVEASYFSAECPQHNGMHCVLNDGRIYEIIPENELEKEQKNPGYVPKATNLLDAEVGTTGELVFSMFWNAFPFIRYRTDDIIKLETDFEKCGCGRTYPKISVKGRRIEMVKVWGEMIYIAWFNDEFSKPFKNGTLQDYIFEFKEKKQTLTLKIVAKSKNKEKFLQEIQKRFYKTLSTYGPGPLIEKFIKEGVVQLKFQTVPKIKREKDKKAKRLVVT